MSKRALFLDRDGVVNIDKGYVYKIEDFEFVTGIFELCRYFQEKGYLLIIVTNQSGIARKLYTETDYKLLTTWMLTQFKTAGITINKVFHCPDHPDFTGPSNRRKPNPGMLFEAAKAFEIDLKESIMVGDKQSDMEAATRAGLGYQKLVNTNGPLVLADITSLLQ